MVWSSTVLAAPAGQDDILRQFFGRNIGTKIRGVGYQPTPPELFPLSEATETNSKALDYYSMEYQHLHMRDLPLLRLMGCNVIRLWGWHEDISHETFLNLAYNDGNQPLYVIVPFDPGFGQGNNFDVTDNRPSRWKKIGDRFRVMLQMYQRHPAVLMWSIGNEPNAHFANDLGTYFRLMELLSKIRDEACPPTKTGRDYSCWHPITVPLADATRKDQGGVEVLAPGGKNGLLLELDQQYPNAVDVWSFQLYRGASFGTFFQDYATFQQIAVTKGRRQKPTLLTEFGLDVLDFRIRDGEVNETMQADVLTKLWKELERVESGISLGGVVFEFVDEWWKAKSATKPIQAGCPATRENTKAHLPCGWGIAGYDELIWDGFYSEAWFGLFAQNSNLQCVVPRASYFALMKLWTGKNNHAVCVSEECCALRSPLYYIMIAQLLGLVLAFGIAHKILRCVHLKRTAAALELQEKAACTATAPLIAAKQESSRNLARMRQQLEMRLARCFDEIQFAKQHAHPLGQLAHAKTAYSVAKSLLNSQLSRIGDPDRTILRVHGRMFEGYRAWCAKTSLAPRFSSEKLQDIAEMMLLWSTCEQMRRVPSFVCTQFHCRNDRAASGSDGTSFESSDELIKAVDSYKYNYDDVDDLLRQNRSSGCNMCLKIWDHMDSPHAFPEGGGWVALVCNFFYIIRLHLLIYAIIVDVVSRPHPSQWFGIMDFYAHFSSSASAATLLSVCVMDCWLLCAEQFLDVYATVSLRLKHVVVIGVVAEILMLMTGMQQLGGITTATIVSMYCYARFTHFFVNTLVRISNGVTNRSILPGAWHSHVQRRHCKELSWTLAYFARSFGFWFFVFVVKILFDVYVLWPSAAGVTESTLCSLGGAEVHGACIIFVYVLWIITFVMSMASTYVSYVFVTSLLGNVVPHIFAKSSRWEKPWIVAVLVAFWLAIILSLLVGSLLLALSVAAPLLVLSHSLTVRSSDNWDQCRCLIFAKLMVNLDKRQMSSRLPQETFFGSPKSAERALSFGRRSESLEAKVVSNSEHSVIEMRVLSGDNSAQFPSPVTVGLQRTLQCLFVHHLTFQQAKICWDKIIDALWKCDLLSKAEIRSNFSFAIATTPQDDSFLARAPKIREGRQRLTHFLRSLRAFRKKKSAKLPTLQAMRSLTVLIPVYNETVYFTWDQLVSTAPNKQVSLIEFLVEQNKDEFNNFVERVGYPEGVQWGVADDGLTRYARALLDRFLMPHHGPPGSSQGRTSNSDIELEVARDWQEYEAMVCEWASYRGQTLARTVRGLEQIREALLFIGSMEMSNNSADVERLVDEKFQLIVAAQIFGNRHEKEQRAAMRQLMARHPRIEIVYDFNVKTDVKARIAAKNDFYVKCTQTLPQEEITPARKKLLEILSFINEDLGPGVDPPDRSVVLRVPNSSSKKPAHQAPAGTERSQIIFRVVQQVYPRVRALAETLSSLLLTELSEPGSPDADQALCDVAWHETIQILYAEMSALSTFIKADTQLQHYQKLFDEFLKELQAMLQIQASLDTYQAEITMLQILRTRNENACHAEVVLQESLAQFQAQVAQTLQSLSLNLDTSPPKADKLDAGISESTFNRKFELLESLSQAVELHNSERIEANQTQLAALRVVLGELQWIVSEPSGRDERVFDIEDLRTRVTALENLVGEKWTCERVHNQLSVSLSGLKALQSLSLNEGQRACLQEWLGNVSSRVRFVVPNSTWTLSELAAFLEEELSNKLVRKANIERKIVQAKEALDHWLVTQIGEIHSEGKAGPEPDVLEALIVSLLGVALRLAKIKYVERLQPHAAPLESSVVSPPRVGAAAAFQNKVEIGLNSSNVGVSMSVNLNLNVDIDFKSQIFETKDNQLLHELMEMCRTVQADLLEFRILRIEGQCPSVERQQRVRERPYMTGGDIDVHKSKLSPEAVLDCLVTFSKPFFSIHVRKALRGRGFAAGDRAECVLNAIGRNHPLKLGTLKGCPSAPQTNAKSENQLHALVFARGEVIQTIDMNQDFYFEEALKMRLFLEEFQFNEGFDVPRFTLVGCPEVIYTENVSAVGRFMAMQDMSFVTIVQRMLAYTGVRMHYGHPDIFDGFWCRFHVGLSKASAEVNLSEDLFFGLDNMSRGGKTGFIEYVRFGKGREVGLQNCTIFEDKISRGAAVTLKTPDFYRLEKWLDSLTGISVLFGTIGHFLYTLLFDYAISSFLWVMLLMGITAVSSEKIGSLGSVYAIPWILHLGFAFGLPLLAQLIYDIGFFSGFKKWIETLLLGSIYYLFQLRTKAYAVQQAFGGGSAQYQGTGRSFSLEQLTLLELYKLYAHSHYSHALQLLALLVLYALLLAEEPVFSILLKTYAILLACWSWIFAPALFNPIFASEQLNVILKAKKQEVKDLFAWVASESQTGDSWQRWWWQHHFATIRLRDVRYRMHQSRAASDCNLRSGLRLWAHHPVTQAFSALFSRMLVWTPYAILVYGLFLKCQQTLVHVAVYMSVVGFVHCFTSRNVHTLVLATVLLLYYSYLQLDNIIFHPFYIYSSAAYSLPLNHLSAVFSALVIVQLIAMIFTDLLIVLAVSSQGLCGLPASTDGWNERPWLVKKICCSRLFFPWQLCVRYLTPYTVGVCQWMAMCVTCTFARAHVFQFYNISLGTLIGSKERRAINQRESPKESPMPK